MERIEGFIMMFDWYERKALSDRGILSVFMIG